MSVKPKPFVETPLGRPRHHVPPPERGAVAIQQPPRRPGSKPGSRTASGNKRGLRFKGKGGSSVEQWEYSSRKWCSTAQT